MRIFLLSFYFLLYTATGIPAESFFEEGERFFIHNDPEKAVPLLELAVSKEPENEKAFLYLGIAYEQLGKYDRAVGVLKQGIGVAKRYTDTLFFNLGNNLFKLGQFAAAADAYAEALKANPSNADAYLNRANTQVKIEDYTGAVENYRTYLSLRPDSPQRERIVAMIDLLTATVAERERKKQEEEEARRLEEARQKALLEEVLMSLSEVSGETTNLQAGKEDIKDYSTQSDIED